MNLNFFQRLPLLWIWNFVLEHSACQQVGVEYSIVLAAKLGRSTVLSGLAQKPGNGLARACGTVSPKLLMRGILIKALSGRYRARQSLLGPHSGLVQPPFDLNLSKKLMAKHH